VENKDTVRIEEKIYVAEWGNRTEEKENDDK
jgi:hypothetical protein